MKRSYHQLQAALGETKIVTSFARKRPIHLYGSAKMEAFGICPTLKWNICLLPNNTMGAVTSNNPFSLSRCDSKSPHVESQLSHPFELMNSCDTSHGRCTPPPPLGGQSG